MLHGRLRVLADPAAERQLIARPWAALLVYGLGCAGWVLISNRNFSNRG